MAVDKRMFADFLHGHPFQPATAFWRAVEVAYVARRSLPQGRGLDLGCGDGKLTGILLERIGPRELVGADIDPLETAQAEKTGLYSRVHTGPGNSIPEDSASFDFIFSNSVLEHINPIEPVIAEVSRLLKPGGRMVVTVPSLSFHHCLRGPLLPWISRERYLEQLDVRCAHEYYLDEQGWSALLRKHGLRTERALQYLTTAEVKRWESISRFTGGILYSVFSQRKHPIEIQRTLGLRGGYATLPRPLATMLASILSMGVATSTSTLCGCLLIEAVRN